MCRVRGPVTEPTVLLDLVMLRNGMTVLVPVNIGAWLSEC